MRKRIYKAFAAATLITTIFSSSLMSVVTHADDINDLKNEKAQKEEELKEKEDSLAYLMVQLEELELSMAEKNDEIIAAGDNLAAAEAKMSQQYETMKLRIKYMYENQDSSIAEVFLSSNNMGEVLNKTEYVQQVYDYDRNMLETLSDTATEVRNIKQGLENDKAELEAMAEELTAKQADLYTAIDSLQDEVDDYEDRIKEAARKAAQSSGASGGYSAPIGDGSTASQLVSLAYSFLGIPYVYGGSTPSGFDCSGLTQYIHRQVGISIPRSSGAQAYSGYNVGSLANALPGDIICYPGHVSIYIGNGQAIHAPYEGQVVKIAPANMMTVIAVRRYW